MGGATQLLLAAAAWGRPAEGRIPRAFAHTTRPARQNRRGPASRPRAPELAGPQHAPALAQGDEPVLLPADTDRPHLAGVDPRQRLPRRGAHALDPRVGLLLRAAGRAGRGGQQAVGVGAARQDAASAGVVHDRLGALRADVQAQVEGRHWERSAGRDPPGGEESCLGGNLRLLK